MSQIREGEKQILAFKAIVRILAFLWEGKEEGPGGCERKRGVEKTIGREGRSSEVRLDSTVVSQAKTEMAWLSVLLVEGVKKMIRFLNINF